MTTTPPLTPQIIGRAENAHQPILDRILARTGTTKNQWVALTLTAGAGATIDHDQLTARITDGLKIDQPAARTAIAQLTAAGLLDHPPGQPSHLRLTDSGRARHRQIRSAIDQIVARAYRDIPAHDLATNARVLTLLTTRLNAETADA